MDAATGQSHPITSRSEQSEGVMLYRSDCLKCVTISKVLSLDVSAPRGRFRAFCVRYTKGHSESTLI